MATAVTKPTSLEPRGLSSRSPWLPWIGGSILIALAGLLCVQKMMIDLRLSFANEQTAIFDEMRGKVEKAVDPIQGVEFLEYAVGYYPSGTKQVAGSALDRIVERTRQLAVRDMIGSLRKQTGQDFGDDPQRWNQGLREQKHLRR